MGPVSNFDSQTGDILGGSTVQGCALDSWDLEARRRRREQPFTKHLLCFSTCALCTISWQRKKSSEREGNWPKVTQLSWVWAEVHFHCPALEWSPSCTPFLIPTLLSLISGPSYCLGKRI